MSKSKTIASLVEKASELLQAVRRLEEADNNGYVQCVTCGVVKYWNQGMQGGHFIQRKWLATRLMRENVHPQCNQCNGPMYRGNMAKYTLFMIDKYGREFVENLEVLKHQTRKYYRDEINEIIEQLKAEKKKHLLRIR